MDLGVDAGQAAQEYQEEEAGGQIAEEIVNGEGNRLHGFSFRLFIFLGFLSTEKIAIFASPNRCYTFILHK